MCVVAVHRDAGKSAEVKLVIHDCTTDYKSIIRYT